MKTIDSIKELLIAQIPGMVAYQNDRNLYNIEGYKTYRTFLKFCGYFVEGTSLFLEGISLANYLRGENPKKQYVVVGLTVLVRYFSIKNIKKIKELKRPKK